MYTIQRVENVKTVSGWTKVSLEGKLCWNAEWGLRCIANGIWGITTIISDSSQIQFRKKLKFEIYWKEGVKDNGRNLHV